MTSVRTDERLLDGACLKEVLVSARNLLHIHVDEINRLNVFPVPDGDTGTNMYLTLDAVVTGLAGVEDSLSAVLESVSRHALLGARGNSGVILAQFLAGFAAAVGDRTAVDGAALARGFARGTEEAYHIVSQPQEGTILTIMRAAAEEAARERGNPVAETLVAMMTRARAVLAETPTMLPVLKRAGVIDAGGLGFVYILQAGVEVLHGVSVSTTAPAVTAYGAPDLEKIKTDGPPAHRYCTEFSLQGEKIPVASVREHLAPHADSLLVLRTGKLVHVHLHTDDPGEALQIAAGYGRVFKVKIDDMYQQVDAFLGNRIVDRTPVATGVVAVAPGDGLGEIMRSLGAREVLVGVPSVGDILTAVARVDTAGILILPNDKDIVLAATQAGKLATRSVRVVNTDSVPQGLAALLAFNPRVGLEENVAQMEAARTRVRAGIITRSVRTATLNGVSVHAGEYIGMSAATVVAAGQDEARVALALVGEMLKRGGEIVTLFYGGEITEPQARALRDAIADVYSQVEVQIYYGGQPDRDYIVSVE